MTGVTNRRPRISKSKISRRNQRSRNRKASERLTPRNPAEQKRLNDNMRERIQEGDLRGVQNFYFLGAQADYDPYEFQGSTRPLKTPLSWAVFGRYVEIAKFLLEKGANPNRRNVSFDGGTPLHIAATINHLEIIRLLVENGADLHIRDNNRNTPLDLARDPKTAHLLRELGAKE